MRQLNRSLGLILLFYVPCFARLLNVEKLKILRDHNRRLLQGQTELNTDALFSNNNRTECEYSFHGFSFLISKHVVLTEEKHFKGRNGCSVEFYDLPSGIIYVKLGPKLDGTSPLGLMQSGQRCTNDSSVAKIKIHQISDEDHITELGIFCRIPENENVNDKTFAPKVVPKSPNEEDIAANFEQKLRFDLHKWDGSSLEFRYKQERINLMALYDDQGIKSSKKERKRAWLLSQKLHELEESDQEPFLLYSYDDCTNQGKIFCQQSVKCADGSENYDVSGNRKGVGCQGKLDKFVCLNNSVICDGKFDCMPYDDSDEINCDKLGVGFIYVVISITTTLLVLAFICSLCYCLALRRRKNRQHLTNNTMDRNGNGNFVADPPAPSAPPIEMNAYPHTLVNPTPHTATAAATDVKEAEDDVTVYLIVTKAQNDKAFVNG